MPELLKLIGPVIADLETTDLAQFIGHTPNVYPVVSALHVLGIAMLVGPILIVDAWLLGLLRHRGMREFSSILVRVALFGCAIVIATGFGLFVVQAIKYSVNVAFLIKVGLVTLAGLNALLLRGVVGDVARIERISALTRVAGGVSAAAWIGAILAGRWIAFA